MSQKKDSLQRLRVWYQMEALIRELEELLYRWRDLDEELDSAYHQRCLDVKNVQRLLPHIDTSPEVDEFPRCPLCIARRWP